MTVNEYIARLKKALRRFDAEEVENVIQYYTELFEDAEDPQSLMESFGTPEQLAQKVMAENGWGSVPKPKMTASRIIALVLLSPFWLTVYILIISAVAAVASVYVCFPAFVVGGVFGAFFSGGFAPGIMQCVGLSLVGIGGTLLLIKPLILFIKLMWNASVAFTEFLFGFKLRKQKETEKVRKTNFVPAIIIGAVCLVAGVGIGGVSFIGMKDKYSEYAERLGYEDYSYEFSDDCKNIDINISEAADVNILKSTDGRMYLEAENIAKDRFSVSGGETAKIDYKAEKFGLRFEFFGMKETYFSSSVTLYLPEDMYDRIDINTSCGDVRINGISADKLILSNSCGSVSLDGCTFTAASIDLELGDVEINDCGFESLDISDSCGDIELERVTVNGRLESENELGNTEFKNLTAGSAEVESSCGDVELEDSVLKGESHFDLELGDASLHFADSNYDFRLDTELGEVEINGRSAASADYQRGSVIISVENSCGDISVSC
ncbi:MAG: DUF4097 family beta strand repeat-containing protein [Oscillospiraceae bacterium]